MKNLIIIPIIAFMLVSCSIFGQTKRANRESKECTAINASTVPEAVMQSFYKINNTNVNEHWFQLNKHTYAVLQDKFSMMQGKQLLLFEKNGKKFKLAKVDTIPYGAYVVFSYKYPGIKYQRCFRLNKHSFAVLFNKGGNSELAYYPNRVAVIDEERDLMENNEIDMDNMDLWWDNDRIDEK
jgi:hypothetical protein